MKKRTIAIIIAAVLCVALALTLVLINTGSGERLLTVPELLETAERYLLDGDHAQALVYFERLIELDPMNPRGYTGAAEALIELGRIDDAIDILLQGLELLPDNPEILAMLALLGVVFDEPQLSVEPEPEPEVTPEDVTEQETPTEQETEEAPEEETEDTTEAADNNVPTQQPTQQQQPPPQGGGGGGGGATAPPPTPPDQSPDPMTPMFP